MKRVLAIFVFCIGYVACSSVPEVVFVPDDMLNEGGTVEAGPDIETGPPPVGCPSNPPSGVMCCNDRMCMGDCPTKPNEVAQCKNECRNCPEVCCRAAGAVTGCVAVGAACP